uniref:HTH CENPB-type domain-containing protein n=1 Tax=Cacopsylla melanoneura TaxID=428564 RepID=A0A8D8Z1Q5_9HEMI
MEGGRKNPFNNNYPGDGWYNAFLKRHPQITERTAEPITATSACVSEEDIRGYFEKISKTLTEEGHKDILKDSSRVFNGDETCFLFCPKNSKVLARKGSTNV